MTMPVLSYSHGTSAIPLLGETIGENLRMTVERFGDREALVVRYQNYRATYSQLWEQVSLAARGLLANGVRKGERVGIWSPNRYEWVVTQYATARIGAILVNINPAYKTSELEYALNQSGVSLLSSKSDQTALKSRRRSSLKMIGLRCWRMAKA
jgi:fatty-acyl-CoA synthase